MKLDGKVAAITGGSAGIGRAIAEAFLAEGAKVAIMARNPAKAEAMLAELNAGDHLIFIQGDAMDQASIEHFVTGTAEQFGRLDILVNNAGGAGDLQPAANLSDESFDECMKWNVYSTCWGTRRALQLMLPQKWGRVINISSMEGKHGKPVLTAYSTAKHAVNGMTKSIAREVGTEGITVNAICPGYIATEMVMAVPEKVRDSIIAQIPAGRLGEAPEIARCVVFLASDDAGFITGSTMTANGGQYMT
mgnify:CR=1 FL=1